MKLKSPATSQAGLVAGVAAAAAAAVAVWVRSQARRAERRHPPRGRIVTADGVDLHCVERGSGPVVVLIHGNMVSLEDYEVSGLIERLARNHRVIAFDRPGFGHSPRPRDRLWTAFAQARTIHAALQALGVDKAVVVGHSMGTLVALALALDHPEQVSGLTLLSGYYYPTVRYDAVLMVPVALPVLGDVMRYTVTALASRAALKGAVKGMFTPAEIPGDFFATIHREMMLRPLQLRANAEDATFMMPGAAALAKRYGELRLPVVIVAGDRDIVVDRQAHAERLHAELPQSRLVRMAESGHMVHHADPDRIVHAIGMASVPSITAM